MSLSDLDKAIELIEEYGGGDFEGGKDQAIIEKAENVLEVEFPPTYLKFLSTLGAGDIEGLEFYGVINEDFENSGIPDAVWLTLNERKHGLPKHLIIIYSAGDGTYYAIDTSQINSHGESPIVSVDTMGKINKISDDFGSFLLSELQTVL